MSPPKTTRNRSAVLYLIGKADGPYRAIAKQACYCAAPAGGPAG